MRPNAPAQTDRRTGAGKARGFRGMSLIACEPDDFPVLARRSVLPDVLLKATGATALLVLCAAVGGTLLFGQAEEATLKPQVAAVTSGKPAIIEGLFSPSPFSGRMAHLFGQSAPLRAVLARPAEIATAVVASVALAPETPREIFGPVWVPPLVEMAEADTSVPLPLPRPAEFSARPIPPTNRRMTAALAPAPEAAPATNAPGLLERLFGSKEPTGPALAYANPNDGVGLPKISATAPLAGGTAVYDISAKTVFMPDGTRLEAHSGLKDMLDDPNNVHVRMRGATPPATYDLKLREALFHGVQAIRLTPIDSNVHGRTGLLAHTYMLGPNGDSNGCVSFREYNTFLQAFLAGKIRRLTVVARR